MLPEGTRVGYISDIKKSDRRAWLVRYFGTKYAIAPRVLEEGTDPNWLIVNAVAYDPRLIPDGMVLVRDFGDGLMLFRRRKGMSGSCALALILVALVLGTFSSAVFLWEWVVGAPTPLSALILLISITGVFLKVFFVLKRRIPRLQVASVRHWIFRLLPAACMLIGLGYSGIAVVRQTGQEPNGRVGRICSLESSCALPLPGKRGRLEGHL